MTHNNKTNLTALGFSQLGVDIDGEAADDGSGTSVSLSADGTVMAIGAPQNDGSGRAGYVRVYAWDGSTWVQRGNDIDGEAASDGSGSRVSLSADGMVLAIGAPLNDGTDDTAGHVRVYVWDGSTWVQRGSDIDGEAAFDQSGSYVSLSADGTVVAIGAPLNDDTDNLAGHVRVYVWDGSTWVQRGSDIDGEAGGDESGSVSLSADGTVVAIGGIFNSGAAPAAGHVRVYVWDGSTWVQRGSDIEGDATLDRSGGSVSLSADGTLVAIGADGGDAGGEQSGRVRVYTFTNGGSATDDIEVFARPTVSFSALTDYCEDVEEQRGLGGGTPVGGVYSGPGVVDNGNGTTFTLVTADAGVGTHTITYTYCIENEILDNRVDLDTAFPSDSSIPVFEADDFTATDDVSNLTIQWKGVYDTDAPPATDDFIIAFFSDNGGVPGTLLQSFPVGNAVNRVNSGEFINVFSYSTDLVFNLTAGTTYWINIYGNSPDANDLGFG